MKVRPGVVTTLGDLNSSREITRKRVVDTVKQKIRDVLCNVIITNMGTGANSRVQSMVHAGLNVLQVQDVIRDFKVDSVEIVPHKPFREVDCLPITAKPGDPLIVDHVDENGDLVEVYRGIVISTNGEGNGIVFSRPCDLDKEGQIMVRCSVRPTAVVESIVIEIQQEY